MSMIEELCYISVSKLNLHFLKAYYNPPVLMLKQLSQDRERFGHLLLFDSATKLCDTVMNVINYVDHFT